ncbi:hypothetical protein F2P79_025317 [Pimephales promelas]|nr:hypothetical protein F2P79_025317 [Pimephales promelas]
MDELDSGFDITSLDKSNMSSSSERNTTERITVWYSSCTTENPRALTRIVKTAQRIIGIKLLDLTYQLALKVASLERQLDAKTQCSSPLFCVCSEVQLMVSELNNKLAELYCQLETQFQERRRAEEKSAALELKKPSEDLLRSQNETCERERRDLEEAIQLREIGLSRRLPSAKSQTIVDTRYLTDASRTRSHNGSELSAEDALDSIVAVVEERAGDGERHDGDGCVLTPEHQESSAENLNESSNNGLEDPLCESPAQPSQTMEVDAEWVNKTKLGDRFVIGVQREKTSSMQIALRRKLAWSFTSGASGLRTFSRRNSAIVSLFRHPAWRFKVSLGT